MAELEELTGSVVRLNCQKPHFCAGYLKDIEGERHSFRVKGYVRLGDSITLRGNWTNDPKWGDQFDGKTVSVSMPVDAEGVIKWLSWNCIRVGPVLARRMIAKFGVALMDVAATDPNRVADACGVPLEVVQSMASTWGQQRGNVGAIAWFAAHGLSQRQCEAAVEKFGASVVQLAQDDPFQLLGRVEGFGWATTDALAASLGITGDDPRRLCGALAAVVREARDQGSTCVNVRVAYVKGAEKIGDFGTVEKIGEIVAQSVEKKQLVCVGGGSDETDYLAVPFAHEQESLIWRVLRGATGPNPFGYQSDDAARACAETYRRSATFDFDDTQVEAIFRALRYRVSVVTGSAGSGKTSVLRAIVRAYDDCGAKVRLSAPTGKAARRMTEVIGRQATTMHRMLGFNGFSHDYEYHPGNPLDDCLIIVDECSMCDADMMYRLLAAAGPRTAIVFVGDPHQLPPVGAGNPLRDILAHDLAPVTRLAHCHRQSGPLKTNCAAILERRVEPIVMNESGKRHPWVVDGRAATPEHVANLVTSLYEKHLPQWGYDPVADVQFVTAKHDGAYGTKRLNLILQRLHQAKLGNVLPEPTPGEAEARPTIYVGDKVIQKKNNYNRNVMNGEVGEVVGIDLTRDEVLEEMGISLRAGTKLYGPVADDPDGRNVSLCPVCFANAPFAPNVLVKCRACGTRYYSERGQSAPPEFVDFEFGDEPDAAVARGDGVVAEYLVKFHGHKSLVAFPKDEAGDLHLAYCLTVHSMQGSQVPCVVVVAPKSHRFMQTNGWLYTAATRAQTTCVLIGDGESMRRAAEKVTVDERQTLLRIFFQHEQARP